MYSSEDLERFYFQYQTKADPRGVSLQLFCSTNNVPYNLFHKWYKDTHRKIVEVEVERGLGSTLGFRSVFSFSGPPSRSPSPYAGNKHLKPCKGARVLLVRICLELTLSNGLHPDYSGRYRLIQKLEGLC